MNCRLQLVETGNKGKAASLSLHKAKEKYKQQAQGAIVFSKALNLLLKSFFFVAVVVKPENNCKRTNVLVKVKCHFPSHVCH